RGRSGSARGRPQPPPVVPGGADRVVRTAAAAARRKALAALMTGNPGDLIDIPPTAARLGEAFAAAGHQLYLVGGPVRDALMGRPVNDLDFTTDARPEQVLGVLDGLATTTWTTGID